MTTETDSQGAWQTDDTYYYRTGSNESVTTAVVRAVGAVSGRSPILTDGDEEPLEPLYETVDTGALDALFRDAGDAADRTVTVQFEYCDHDVTVDATGLVSVTRT